MRRLASSVLVAALSLVPFHSAVSGYTANVNSTVKWVKIYNSDVIFFELANQPTPCTNPYFVIGSGISDKQRDRYYAMLVAAKSSNQLIGVGYGTAAEDCENGSVLVHALALIE